MNEDFVTYEQAVKLKELGFDWDCNHYYHLYDELPILSYRPKFENFNKFDKNWSAPSLSQVHKWLREVKDIIIGIDFDNYNDKYECYVYKRMGYNTELIRDTYGSQLVTNEFHEDFDTYEQALSAGIDRAIELLNNQENGK